MISIIVYYNKIQQLLIIGLFLFCLSYPVYSEQNDPQPIVHINDSTGKYYLGKSIKFLEDREGKLTLQDIMSEKIENQFRQSNATNPNFGFSQSTYWFMGKLEYSGKYTDKKHVLLEIAYPLLDQIELFIIDHNGRIDRHITGDYFPFSKRDVIHNTFLFQLILDHHPLTYYLKIKTQSSVQVPLLLWFQSQFTEHAIAEKFLFGIFFGTVFIMCVYNLLLFITIKDINALYYLLFCSAFFLFQITLKGYAFQFFWPDLPWWGNKSLPFFILATDLTGYLFTKKFLDLRNHSLKLDAFFSILIIICAFFMLLSFKLSYGLSIKVATIYSLIWSIILLTTGVIFVYKGNKTARFFLYAWVALLSGVFLYTLKTLGIIPTSLITEYGIQLGSINLVMMLSIAIVDKVNIERKRAEKNHKQSFLSSSNLLKTHQKLHENQQFIAKDIQENADTVLIVSKNLVQNIAILAEKSENIAERSRLISDRIAHIITAISNMKTTVERILMAARKLVSNMDSVYQSIDDMSDTMDLIEKNTKKGSTIAGKARQFSDKTKQTMSDLKIAIKEIDNVTDVIKHISDKTNLLSLNTAIEAASAGDAGKGFAIVARFIHKFAEKSATAADEISQRIFDIQNKSQDAIDVIEEITNIIVMIHESSDTIYSSIETQVQTSSTISLNATKAKSRSKEIFSLLDTLSQEVHKISLNSDSIKNGAQELTINTSNVNVCMMSNQQSIEQIRYSLKGLSDLSSKMIFDSKKQS
jgi:methyl-accepting chemotaxis protein